MLSASRPAAALDTLQEKLERSTGSAARSLRALLILISPSRPDSVEALATTLRDSGIWDCLQRVIVGMPFNPERTRFGAVEDAVQHVGLERMHQLAVALLLMRCYQEQSSLELRDDMEILALASGFLAREFARRQGSGDPDFAMICTLMRNFGRLVIASTICESSSEVREWAGGVYEDDDYVRIFGLTPSELSHHLAVSDELPSVVAVRLAGSPGYLTTAAPFTYEDEILQLTDFTLRACITAECVEKESGEFSVLADRLLADLDMPAVVRGWEVETMLITVVQQLSGPDGGLPADRRGSAGLERLRRFCQRAVS
mgnify:CR=1 FL=1